MTATAETPTMGGLASHLRPGDYVVGSFGREGRRLKKGQTIGDPTEVSALVEKIREHALRRGSPLTPTGAKAKKMGRGRKQLPRATPFNQEDVPAASAITEISLTPIIPQKSFVVVFVNRLGRIKVKVLGLLEQPGSLVLVFADDEAVTFEPNVGEELELEFSGKKEKVMYPGYLHTWIDGTTKLMILAKYL